MLIVPPILDAIEGTAFSTWLRETMSPLGFYFILSLHTLGLAMLVGPNAAIDLRLLGVGRELPLAPMAKWFRLMWIGFGTNAVTGLLLLYAYPTKALTNPVFYLKLTLIGIAFWTLLRIKKNVFSGAGVSDAVLEVRGKPLAITSLALWVAAITAGRLLAYTYTYILYGILSPGG